MIVSEYGGQAGAKAGALSLLDLKTEIRQVLYDGGRIQSASSWGTPDCLDAPGKAFNPHGIHFSRRADGQMQVLAVQHGG